MRPFDLFLVASVPVSEVLLITALGWNLGNLPLIIIPTICKEKASRFGERRKRVCRSYGLAYVSLSMAIGAIFLWSFVYNIVRVSSSQAAIKPIMEPLLPSEDCSTRDYDPFSSPSCTEISMTSRIKLHLVKFSESMNLKAVIAPSTTGAIVGFIIGMIPWVRSLLIGGNAPLRVIQDSAPMLGDAAILSVTLIMGGNLLKGLKGSGVQPDIVIGIIVVRYIFLPLLGILIAKSTIHFGLFAIPPAMNIGTITQLFGAGQSDCSVIMLWAHSLASVSLTLWSTFFMWLVD
ncbi:PIN-LIKES 3-like protein [Drosera capensis]